MPVKSILVQLYIPTSHSLKNKRSIVQSIIKKIRNHYNVSIAEIDGFDKWQYVGIGIWIISNDSIIIQKMHDDIISFIENNYPELQILGIEDYD